MITCVWANWTVKNLLHDQVMEEATFICQQRAKHQENIMNLPLNVIRENTTFGSVIRKIEAAMKVKTVASLAYQNL